MAIINFYTKEDEAGKYTVEVIDHKKGAIDWILSNIEKGRNFSVYSGQLSRDHEISRDFKKISEANEVSVFLLPGEAITVAYVIAAVLVVTALTVQPKALPNLNRAQQSPNNNLSDRNNRPRLNQRIVDICGRIKSIPDVLSREYTRFVDNSEVRVGYYCVARNNLIIEDIKEGDTLISDIKGASAGVYGADKSPNNSSPDIQIGELIDEPVYNVTQSADATGQKLLYQSTGKISLTSSATAFEAGYITDPFPFSSFDDFFSVGDIVNLVDIKVSVPDGGGGFVLIPVGEDTHLVTAVEPDKITFDISGDSSWSLIPVSGSIDTFTNSPIISEVSSGLVGPFKMTTFKINKLLVNVSAINGIYKDDAGERKNTTVQYAVRYHKLDDNGNPIGSLTEIIEGIEGKSSSQKGLTTEIDLGGDTFVQWEIERLTPLNTDASVNVIDEISVSSVFGLADIVNSDFGNVTTIQTRRTNEFLTAATKTPEVNCIATELVQKYDSGVFATELTPNTQAMQSLIRLALDPLVGRRATSELDLDLLVSIQEECETYFGSSQAGSFNYSFDSTSLSAQELFLTIGKAAFITLWREGRVLKGLFERPQSIPTMVFTHRSKQKNAETWNRKRNTSDSKDSIEFVYTDPQTHAKETLFFPADKSGLNPSRIEMPGISGILQANWHMMRTFNKQLYQEITVDFGATAEGRFVKPNSLISVVKGARVHTFDGNIIATSGLLITLSQNVTFTDGDSHSVVLKRRDGSTESILCFETSSDNVIELIELPSEEIYIGNDELKTEFSFGNEARLSGQLMLPQEISPNGKQYTKIKAINYSDLYYQNDTDQAGRAFSSGFSSGFN